VDAADPRQLLAFELRAPAPGAPGVLALALQSGSTPLGAGCELQLGPAFAIGFALTDARRVATLPIPDQQSFVGLELHAQGATLDPLAPLGFGLTARLRLRFGG
jgi:hypothetical protein